MIVAALAHCQTPTCREPITVRDVVREKSVNNAPSHVVIIYKCPACGRTDRMVGTREGWDTHVRQFYTDDAEAQKVMAMAELDLELFNDVDGLVALWASYKNPPPLDRKRTDR